MEGKHKTLEECEKKCKALPKSLGGLLGYPGYNVEAMYRPSRGEICCLYKVK